MSLVDLTLVCIHQQCSYTSLATFLTAIKSIVTACSLQKLNYSNRPFAYSNILFLILQLANIAACKPTVLIGFIPTYVVGANQVRNITSLDLRC